MRVLIVEDDEALRRLLGELMVNFGHTPFIARNTEKAAELLGPTRPDLILLDLLVEGAVSTPFIKLARDLMPNKWPRIVMLSAMKNAECVAQSNNVEFIQKPFDLDKLQRVIEGEYAKPVLRKPDKIPSEARHP